MAASYYKIIDGVRYDREMLDIAEEAVKGQGDGRISVEDAKKLYEAIIDGNTVTEIEEVTLVYIRGNFKFTDAADEWLKKEMEAWLEKKNGKKKSSPKSKKVKPLKSITGNLESGNDKKLDKPSAPKKPDIIQAKRTESLSANQTHPARQVKKEPSSIGKGLAAGLVLLVLIAFFIGKYTTGSGENPALVGKITELESLVKSKDIEIVAANAKGDELEKTQRRIAELEDEIQRENQAAVDSENESVKRKKLQAKIDELESTIVKSEQDLADLKSETAQYREKINQLQTARTADTPKVGDSSDKPTREPTAVQKRIASTIEQRLAEEFADDKIQFDKERLLVTFLPNQSFFESGRAVLNDGVQEIFKSFFPKLVQTIKSFDEEIVQVQFQGHSSSNWKTAKDQTEAYLKNLGLSILRAEAALKFCLELKEVEDDRAWLTKRMVSAGFADNRPVMSADNIEDAARSRRITIAIGTTLTQ